MGDTTDELIDLAQQIVARCRRRASSTCCSPPASGSRWRCSRWRSPTSASPRASFTGSQAGVHHRLGPRQGPDHRHHARAGSSKAHRRGQHRDRRRLPGRLARTPRTSPRSAAAAPTPRRSRSPRRSSAEVCEIYTDVDGVFTADPRIVPNARRLDRDHLRGDARDGGVRAPRSCTCAASSTPGATTCRSTSARRSRSKAGTWIVPSPPKGADHRGAGDHHRRRARPQRGQGHRRRRARQARRGGRDLRGARRRRDQHRHDRAERLGRGHRPHRRLVHAAARPTARPRWRRWQALQGAGRLRPTCSTTTTIGKVSLDRRRHALAPRRLGDVLRRAGRRRRQRRDDLDLGDPDLGRSPRHRPRPRPSRRRTPRSTSTAPRTRPSSTAGTGR